MRMSDRFNPSDDGSNNSQPSSSQVILPEADKLMKDYLKELTGQDDCAWRILRPISQSITSPYKVSGGLKFTLTVPPKIPANVARDVMIELSGDPNYADFIINRKSEIKGTEFIGFREVDTAYGKSYKRDDITPELLVLSLPSEYKAYFANALALYKEDEGKLPNWLTPFRKTSIYQFLPTRIIVKAFKRTVGGGNVPYEKLHEGVKQFKQVIEMYKNLQ